MFLKVCCSVEHKELFNLSSALLGVHIHQWTQEFYEGDQDTPNNWRTQSQNRRTYNFKQYSQAHRPPCICFCSFGSNIGQHFRNILLVLWNNLTKGKQFLSQQNLKRILESDFLGPQVFSLLDFKCLPQTVEEEKVICTFLTNHGNPLNWVEKHQAFRAATTAGFAHSRLAMFFLSSCHERSSCSALRRPLLETGDTKQSKIARCLMLSLLLAFTPVWTVLE